MGLWDRLFGQPKGRHARGSAVVFPVAPPARPSWSPPASAAEPAAPAPPLAPPAPPLRQALGAPATLSWPDVTPAPAPVPAGPRGEITFRDGTTAALDPDQARELADIAAVLTRRDQVKH